MGAADPYVRITFLDQQKHTHVGPYRTLYALRSNEGVANVLRSFAWV